MSQSVRAKGAGARDLTKLTALFTSKCRNILRLRFVTLVLWYLILVGHTQVQVGHLNLVILKVHAHIKIKLII